MQLLLRLVCGLALLAFPIAASAQNYPSKSIRLIVPFPAGGPNDIIARVVGQKMSDLLGQSVVIDNRGGAGGVIGTDVVAKAAPDGYTIALTSAGALSISVSVQDKVPYDSLKDFAPITLVASVPELLVVPAKLPVSSVKDLVALAKSKPKQLNFASSGSGSMPHLAGELFRMTAGIDIVHVPYRGAAPAVNDLLGGQVQMMFADIPVLLPHVKSGALKALGVGSKARAPSLPDVPTLAELGLPQVEAENWYGMVAPAGTPPAIVAKLHDAVAAALKSPEVQQKLSSQGASLIGNSPEAFGAYIRSEMVKWAKVAKASGAKAE
ncbi:MAG TPA: tripartite tricarboxylate transporter substrate binding protein [Xanthobacteraceae bacterium]|jgi:tripartite-type tricarboxylate transporter receptor subunit TctC|nr:tripartite tricarboxylate transporter substrate binding protein [Xanthobacteraceae bacterium]